MTKGAFARHFGGDEVINQLTDEKPSKTHIVYFLVSLVFQIILIIYKRIKSNFGQFSYWKLFRKYLGEFWSTRIILTMKLSKCFAVDNSSNVYGLFVLIFLSTVSLGSVCAHYSAISSGNTEAEPIVPFEFLNVILVCVFHVFLPFVKSYPLRCVSKLKNLKSFNSS